MKQLQMPPWQPKNESHELYSQSDEGVEKKKPALHHQMDTPVSESW